MTPATPELVFTNAQIVTETEIVRGSLLVEDGKIASLDTAPSYLPAAIDLGGDYLLPGLIDVHTDHFEKHAMPRSGVFWPALPAALSYDAAVVASGVTTVFDALCLGTAGKPYRRKLLPLMLDGLRQARQAGMLRAEHFLHLRCDLLDPELENGLERYGNDPALRFITLLDDSAERHSIDYYRRVQRERSAISDADLESQVQRSLAEDSGLSARRRRVLAEFGRNRGIPVANHDDSRARHIAEATTLTMNTLEFAITTEAAVAAKAAGMTVIAGAPNVVNGGSHFGNVSAADLVLNGTASILCSDYVPSSLLQAAFALARNNDASLPSAVALMSANPARKFGLLDRGVVEPGRAADLIRVTLAHAMPATVAVWRTGRRIF